MRTGEVQVWGRPHCRFFNQGTYERGNVGSIYILPKVMPRGIRLKVSWGRSYAKKSTKTMTDDQFGVEKPHTDNIHEEQYCPLHGPSNQCQSATRRDMREFGDQEMGPI